MSYIFLTASQSPNYTNYHSRGAFHMKTWERLQQRCFRSRLRPQAAAGPPTRHVTLAKMTRDVSRGLCNCLQLNGKADLCRPSGQTCLFPSQTPAETAVFTSFRASFLTSSRLPGYRGTRTKNPHAYWLPSAAGGGDFPLTTVVIHVYQHPQQVQQQLTTQKYVNQLLINSSKASSWFLRTR